jgi:NAD(P)-dependent dehydrogenase (short-subunit alcohol dehydrogenase family)
VQREGGLQNKRVVILGGSSWIGLAVAEQASSKGAKSVIASRNAERVQKAIESFFGVKVNRQSWSCDMRSRLLQKNRRGFQEYCRSDRRL